MSRVSWCLSLLCAGALLLLILAGSDSVAGLPPQGRAGSEDSLAIIVNRSNPVESLSLGELRKVFMGDQTHWSNGRRITVLMLEPGKPERQAALSQIYKMDEKDFNDYFLHSMFTGEVRTAPKAMASGAEVVKFVFNVPGAIGYVRVAEADNSVKVVRIDSRLPSEREYAIRLHGRATK